MRTEAKEAKLGGGHSLNGVLLARARVNPRCSDAILSRENR